MKTFKRLQFGSVPVNFTTPQIDTTEQILISYLRGTSHVAVLLDTEATLEIFKLSRQYVGSNFRNWLIANYSNGSGTRAALCRAILNWVTGKVSSKAVTSEVRRDLNRIDFLKTTQDQVQVPFLYNGDEEAPNQNVSFDAIEDRHYFEFLGLLGPELTAHFLLSLDGIRFVK